MGTIINVHTKKELKVANPSAIIKRFPRDFKLKPQKEISKEIKAVEDKMELDNEVSEVLESLKNSKRKTKKKENQKTT